MVTKRNNTVDFLKCICIFGVVLHHCSNRRLLPEVQGIFTYAADLTDWCVIGFIGLSGFLEANRSVTDSNLKSSSIRDFNRLLMPFILLSFVYCGLFQVADLCGFQLRSSVSSTFMGKFIDTLLCREGGIAEQLYFLPLLLGIRIACRFASRGLPFVFVAITCYILFFVNELQLTGFSQATCLLGLQAYILGLYTSNNAKRAVTIALIVGISVGITVHNWQVIVGLLLPTLCPILKVDVPFFNLIGSAAGTVFAYHTPILLQPLIIGISHIHGTLGQCIALVITVIMLTIGIAFLRRRLLSYTSGLLRILLF